LLAVLLLYFYLVVKIVYEKGESQGIILQRPLYGFRKEGFDNLVIHHHKVFRGDYDELVYKPKKIENSQKANIILSNEEDNFYRQY